MTCMFLSKVYLTVLLHDLNCNVSNIYGWIPKYHLADFWDTHACIVTDAQVLVLLACCTFQVKFLEEGNKVQMVRGINFIPFLDWLPSDSQSCGNPPTKKNDRISVQ